MDTFKKKSLYAALAGIGALGATGAAQAVNVNPDGLGQALIYPYYTVRSVGGDAYNSLLSVVNSTASAKGVKVRFLEGKNSREVLDFNLYLSAFDVWTAAIIPHAGGGAAVTTNDNSCTTPVGNLKSPTGQEFVNFILTDAAGNSLDRTREGYVEIIEMGDIRAGTVSEDGVTHANGVNNIPTCTGLTDAVIQANTELGSGGLFGGITLINVHRGGAYSADAIALEAFRTVPPAIWNPPGSVLPDLTQALPPTATVFTGGAAATYPFAAGIDAVSAVLMHNQLMNEIVLDTLTNSGTDWVVTFPTKRFYVTATSASPPFQRNFVSSGSCDDIGINVWDREERTGSPPDNFSPPQTIPGTRLCWEANIITWNASNVFASTNSVNVDVNSIVPGYQNGWARLNFVTRNDGTTVTEHRLVALNGATFNGLPVVGFAAHQFNNNTLLNAAGLNVQSAYGTNFNHKYTRSIQ
jgi:hypothetical protein